MSKKMRFFELSFIIYALWYYLPISKGLFSSSVNILFFAFYVISMGYLITYSLKTKSNQMTPERKCERNLMFIIVAYMVVFFGFYLAGWKQTDKHIRVSYTFWGTYLFYYAAYYFPHSRNRIGKLLMFTFVVTYITTFIGVMSDISVVRALSDAGSDEVIQKSLLLKNISNVYFMQMTVLIVPLAMYYAFYKRKCSAISRIVTILFMILELYFLISASLTISILLYAVAIVLSVLFFSGERVQGTQIIVFTVFICTLLLVDFEGICTWVADNVNNTYIQKRFISLADIFGGRGASGDVKIRLELYTSSLKTFLEHPFGIGPNYTYIPLYEGIGHHSQMFDDFARYGVFGVLFYIGYLKSLYDILRIKYDKIGLKKVVLPTFLIYVAIIILNLSFRSPYESVFMLYIIYSFADIVYEKGSKTKKCETVRFLPAENAYGYNLNLTPCQTTDDNN